MKTRVFLCALVCLVLVQLLAQPVSAAAKKETLDAGHEPANPPKWYYWNEMSGKVQWEDPGDVPFEDEEGKHFWLDSNNERTDSNPDAHKYAWVEAYSSEQGRPYFFNQETQESTWDRPLDLAWRRVSASEYPDEL